MRARETAKLSAKFQISIPRSVRTAKGWSPGQLFAFIPKGEGVLIVPVPEAERLAGIACGARPEGYRDPADRV
ncbi:MAG TPA: AbrB/MazE/SpoVT family DNA-binding domain-containing protein [Methylocystis sp.]|nr:AbrB/MazE/SpoVT family DNA-binding domain-containing protein [Methylocystis sp.]